MGSQPGSMVTTRVQVMCLYLRQPSGISSILLLSLHQIPLSIFNFALLIFHTASPTLSAFFFPSLRRTPCSSPPPLPGSHSQPGALPELGQWLPLFPAILSSAKDLSTHHFEIDFYLSFFSLGIAMLSRLQVRQSLMLIYISAWFIMCLHANVFIFSRVLFVSLDIKINP